jgi:hypothetical protein
MIVPYKDVSASALCFNLVSRAVDVSTLHPISKTGLILSIGGIVINIEAGILGASHFMTLTPAGGGDTIAEVVVCSEVGAADQRLCFTPLGGNGRIGPLTQSILHGALVYTFTAWTEPWAAPAADTIRNLAGRIERADSDSTKPSTGLVFKFPSLPSGQTDQQALTMVYLESDPDREIHLRTIHSYPNDGVLVVTESKLKKGDRE